MSNEPQDQHSDDGDDDDVRVTVPRKQIRELEKAAKAGRDALAKAAALEREVTFRSAGIDPNDTRLKYFVKGYEGDLSAESIKAAAVEAGFLPGGDQAAVPAGFQPPSQYGVQPGYGYNGQPQPSPMELAALAQANAATQGAPIAPANAYTSYEAALAQAKSPQDVMEIARRFNLPVAGID